jgi:putative FmdB family regulatory protein
MPLFDYRCRQCGHEFEALVLKDDERILCADCGSDSVERVMVSLFSCAGVNLNKQLKMDSEDHMKKGIERMKNQEKRKNRIKIL